MPTPKQSYDFTGPNADAERARMRSDYGVKQGAQGTNYTQFPGQSDPNYISPVAFGEAPPPDTTGILHHAPQWNNHSGNWETPFDWGNLLNIGVGAGLGAGALDAFGAFGAGAGAGSGAGPSTASNIAATTAASHAAPASLAAGGGKGLMAGIFSKGLDPTTMLLGAMSLFGNQGSGPQQREPFTGSVDPQLLLKQVMDTANRLGSQISSQGPTRLKSHIPPPPSPISIPGLPFQIGGGMGMDPAQRNAPTDQAGSNNGLDLSGVFQNPDNNNPNSSVKRRSPV